jgi:hypothetical protein
VLPSTLLRACFATSFENTAWRGLGQFKNLLDYVIPAWTAGIQADTDVSGRILRTWMPAIHAGMTMICIFMFCRRAEDHESLRGDNVCFDFGCGAAALGLCGEYFLTRNQNNRFF